jgi:hypothetical protein
MASQINEMVEVARAFCDLIEGVEGVDREWLSRMSYLLPRLHLAVASLGNAEKEPSHLAAPDLDARFELFTKLRQVLGTRDEYWMEFDVAQDGQFMSGSLADDLTDIYCELKNGLELMDDEPGQALDSWRCSYRMHWGQHLVDAVRHLYELDARNQLDS